LKLGVPVPTIAESLFARWMSGRNHFSSLPEQRAKSKKQKEGFNKNDLKQALKVTYFASYIQ